MIMMTVLALVISSGGDGGGDGMPTCLEPHIGISIDVTQTAT